MIKKLRVRIIVSAIFVFALVIFCISVLVNVVNYRMVTKQADDTIKSIIDYEKRVFDFENDFSNDPEMKYPLFPFGGMMNPEAEYTTRFFVVRYDDDGNVTKVATENIAEDLREEAEVIANTVIGKKKNSGYIGDYRYLKGKDNSENIVVFLNVFQNQQHLRALRLITIMVAVAGLFVVSILIIIFSGMAIQPIVQNIEQQKRFITDASHELKTPLTSITTSLDVIAIENGDNEWTENIRNQSLRMTKLVGELVTLSRLDEAKPLYQKEEFSISDISWEILELHQGSAKAKERIIKTNIEENLIYKGDKNAIGQMLSVLLDNAIRYAKGEGEICFSAIKEHNKISIEISNPTDYQENIDVMRFFDRFYRPDSSRAANDGGSGIGLAIAKAVVEEHGGKITAQCPKGKKMIIKVKL